MWFKERNNFILHFEGFFQHWLPRVEFQIQWIHGVKCCLHWSQAPDSNVPFGGFTAARGGVLILVDSSCLKSLLNNEATKQMPRCNLSNYGDGVVLVCSFFIVGWCCVLKSNWLIQWTLGNCSSCSTPSHCSSCAPLSPPTTTSYIVSYHWSYPVKFTISCRLLVFPNRRPIQPIAKRSHCSWRWIVMVRKAQHPVVLRSH